MSPLALAVLGIIFVIIAAYIVIAKILPMVTGLVSGLFNDSKTLASFMSLLIIVVYILVFSKIINLLLEVEGNVYLSYLNLIVPGINVLLDTLPYVKYILLGALVAWGFKNCK